MKLFLAPLAGMTNAFYRNLYDTLFGGIDAYYAPFIGTSAMRNVKSSVFSDILPENNNNNLTIVPQLLGSNSADFDFFATAIANIGYSEINWNIGCPFHKVARKKKGSGLLPYPDLIKEFLENVCKSKTYDLTLKMRLGYTTYDEGLKVIKLLNDYPLKGVIIHARTASQLYSGTVDVDAFIAMQSISKHTLTYNGDIFSLEDYTRIQSQLPSINNFMLGRGALKNPFLASAIKGLNPTVNNKLIKIKKFHQEVYRHHHQLVRTEAQLLSKMKEFWFYIGIQIDPDGALLKRIQITDTLIDYNKFIIELFDSLDVWTD